jgi:hypothetical protein
LLSVLPKFCAIPNLVVLFPKIIVNTQQHEPNDESPSLFRP